MAAGSVIKTTPKQGTDVARDSAVDYVVSLGAEPTATPTPTPEPTPTPKATGGPVPSTNPDVQAIVDAVIAQVPPIRGLDPKTDVPLREITPKQFKKEFTKAFDAANPPSAAGCRGSVLQAHRAAPAGRRTCAT